MRAAWSAVVLICMIDLDAIEFVGGGLSRPECVLAHESGGLFVADWSGDGGVAIIAPDGTARRLTARDAPFPLRPNGIALEPGGSFLLAHLGDETGGVFRLHPNGAVEPVLTEIDGTPLPPTNYVHLDTAGRLWVTVSTRHTPRAQAYRANVADGFVALSDLSGPASARIVADGLGYTNECLVDPAGGRLYVNETFGRRLSAFSIAGNGSLSGRRTIAEFGTGTFPDGLTFDSRGGIWITSIVSNRIVHVSPNGRQEVLLEDVDADHMAWVEDAFDKGEMGRPHLDGIHSRRLMNISSLAFGGPDLRSGYLGCLLGDRIARFRAPVAGHPPPHWRYDLDRLLAVLPHLPVTVRK